MYPLGRLGSWEGFWKLSRVHATKFVFVLCFGGLGPGDALWRLKLHAKIRYPVLELLLSVH